MGWLAEIGLRRGNVERRPKHHPIPAGARGVPWPLGPLWDRRVGGWRTRKAATDHCPPAPPPPSSDRVHG